MKHFEDIWNEAEELTKNSNEKLPDIINDIKDSLEDLKYKTSTKDNVILSTLLPEHNLLGDILFDLAKISKKININVYLALKDAIDEEKINILEKNEED